MNTTISPASGSALLHSDESERMLLSIAFNDLRRPLLGNLLGLVGSSDFHVEMHGLIWNCVRTLSETGGSHDAASVLDYSRQKGLFIGGVEYIAGLVDDTLAATASDEAVMASAVRVKRYSTLRGLRQLLDKGMQMCSQGADAVDQVLGYVEDEILNLRKLTQTSRTGPVAIQEVLDNALATMERQINGEVTPATPTGLDDLDRIIYGLADEDFVVIGARPSMGKTTLLTNIAGKITKASREEHFLIFSLEMKKEMLGLRMLSSEGHVDLGSLLKANVSENDWSRIADGLESMRDVKIWIDDTPGLTMPEIRARSRAHVAKYGKCKIGLDYIQYVTPRKDIEPRLHVAEVSRGLKNLARELKTSVIALSQLNRDLEARTNKRPMMSDLRESGALEQDADVICFLYRDEVYNKETTKMPGVAEIIVAKHRNGPIGTAFTSFIADTNTFTNLSHH